MLPGLLASAKKILSQRSSVRIAWHKLKAFAGALRYGFPARSLTVIGITGTDGKTTTVAMTAHILHACGVKAGALSTAFFRINGEIIWNETQKTSPSPFVVQRFLRRLVRAGCTHAVLECSSHGLVQGRVSWTWPAVAALTNTSPEHLDYHGTMEQYRKDKGILFEMLRGKGTKVLNATDETFTLYTKIPSSRTVAYGNEKPQASEWNTERLWLSSIHAFPAATSAIIHTDASINEMHKLGLRIAGAFNLDNALCAISCAKALGLPLDQATNALGDFPGVPGRIERIDGGQPFSVFVDFTVTPASYKRTLQTVRSMLAPGKCLLVLTGSCGDRMKEKRPLVGKTCGELADVVVVSNEDPYTEDPQRIIDDVWKGIDQSKTNAHRIEDRLEAIKFLFAAASPGDAVILCGKGSDTHMWLANGQVPWNERVIAKELLQKLAH